MAGSPDNSRVFGHRHSNVARKRAGVFVGESGEETEDPLELVDCFFGTGRPSGCSCGHAACHGLRGEGSFR